MGGLRVLSLHADRHQRQGTKAPRRPHTSGSTEAISQKACWCVENDAYDRTRVLRGRLVTKPGAGGTTGLKDHPRDLPSLLPQPRCCPCPPPAQPRPPPLPSLATPHSAPRPAWVEMTKPCRPVPPARTPPHETHGHRERWILAEWTGHGGSFPIRTTTPATTLDKGQSPSARDPHPHSGVKHPTKGDTKGDTNQSWALMSETLSAELEGRVPPDLVADLVRAVLDESRQAAHDRGVEPTMREARTRLERFVRARSSM